MSFPLAATAGSAIRYAAHADALAADVVAIALLGLATLVIAGLAARTVFGIVRGELRTLSS